MEFYCPSRWKELSKESGSKILPCGDGSCSSPDVYDCMQAFPSFKRPIHQLEAAAVNLVAREKLFDVYLEIVARIQRIYIKVNVICCAYQMVNGELTLLQLYINQGTKDKKRSKNDDFRIRFDDVYAFFKIKTKSEKFPEHAIGKSTKIRVRRCLHLLLGQPDTIYMGRTGDLLLEELTAEIGLDDSIPTESDDGITIRRSGGKTRVMETPSFSFHHMPSPRPAAYSPKEVMYCCYHPHLTSGDGFDPEIKSK
ncbi:hypothetical protein Tco_0838898 [Tanacetum coccineum]|uniref:Uncharacterized protein n=1 Tax=Tanacetum coccineum TaxID=301880 RepID=A0ABQ5AQ66_9ASTR